MIDLNKYPGLKNSNFYLPPTMQKQYKLLKVLDKATGEERVIKDFRHNPDLFKFICVVGEEEGKAQNDGTEKIETPHVCSICNKPYRTEAALKAHNTRYHSEPEVESGE